MDEPLTNSIQCQCGYDRTGLSADAVCPECGQLVIQQSIQRKNLIQAWRTSSGQRARSGLILSAMTLALGLANAAFTIYLIMSLTSPGFKSSTAGLALIYPPLIWIVVQLPLGILAIKSVAYRNIPECNVSLKNYSCGFIFFGLAPGLLLIVVICAGGR